MIVTHVVAMSENRVIGRAGALPWQIPADLRRFRDLTWGHPIIMGRLTFFAIGRVLPGRENIVVSRDRGLAIPGAWLVHSIDEAFELCEKRDWGPVCDVIGGGQLFAATLPSVQRIEMTLIHKIAIGDTFYPEIPLREFRETGREVHLTAELPYSFIRMERLT